MPKQYKILICLLPFVFCIKAQTNLVVNPSFEIYSSCPSTDDELYKSTSWISCSTSPDYFNSCDNFNYVSVPKNFAGYQIAGSGNAYAGFYSRVSTSILPSNYREYIGGNLSTSLIVGTKYYVSCKVSLAFDSSQKINCASNKIGINFSTSSCYNTGLTATSNNAKIFASSVINDTSNWVRITGSFVADSAYNYIILGNFFDDNSTDTLIMDGSSICKSAYYYIDDVCISTDSLFANQYYYTGDITYNSIDAFKVYPIPSKDFLFIDSGINDEYTLTLSTILGKELLSIAEIKDKHYEVNIKNFPPGLLYMNIKSTSLNLFHKLIIE